MTDKERDTWEQYEKLVMSTLTRLESKQDKLSEEITNLKVQAATWGTIASLVVTAAVNFISAVIR